MLAEGSGGWDSRSGSGRGTSTCPLWAGYGEESLKEATRRGAGGQWIWVNGPGWGANGGIGRGNGNITFATCALPGYTSPSRTQHRRGYTGSGQRSRLPLRRGVVQGNVAHGAATSASRWAGTRTACYVRRSFSGEPCPSTCKPESCNCRKASRWHSDPNDFPMTHSGFQSFSDLTLDNFVRRPAWFQSDTKMFAS